MAVQDNEATKFFGRGVRVDEVSPGDHVYLRFPKSIHGIVVLNGQQEKAVCAPRLIDQGLIPLTVFASLGTLCRAGYGCGAMAAIQYRGVAQTFLRANAEVVCKRAAASAALLTRLPSHMVDDIAWCWSCMAHLPEGSTVECGNRRAVVFTEDDFSVAYARNGNGEGCSRIPLFLFITACGGSLEVKDMSISANDAEQMHERLSGHALELDLPSGNFLSPTGAEEAPKSWIRIAKLGRGSFGDVYKAHDGSGKLVAVKVVDMAVAQVDRVMREIDVMSKVAHPHVVTYHGYQARSKSGCTNTKRLEIFLELCDSSLEQLLDSFAENSRRLPMSLVRKYAKHVLSALACLHQHKIIHRDIKAPNVLLSGSVAKLADFGCGKDLTNTEPTIFAGSLAYAAPEQLMALAMPIVCDVKADVWSFGCLVFRMLQWELGWRDVKEIFSGTGLPPGAPNSNIPLDLKSFLEHCFVRDPAQRASADELLKKPWMTCDDAALSELP